MDEKNIKKDIAELAWQNFYETGEIGAYLLYKDLSKTKKEFKKRNKEIKNNNKIK